MLEHVRLWAGTILAGLGFAWTVYWSIRIARQAGAKAEQDRLASELKALKDALANDEKMDRTEFTEVKGRLQKVEADIKHLPTKEQIHSLDLALVEMKADVRELAANIRPLASSVERIDNFLMERARG